MAKARLRGPELQQILIVRCIFASRPFNVGPLPRLGFPLGSIPALASADIFPSRCTSEADCSGLSLRPLHRAIWSCGLLAAHEPFGFSHVGIAAKRAMNSLIAHPNSLFGGIKFPVTFRRQFAPKSLNLHSVLRFVQHNRLPINRKFPVFFPVYQGIWGAQSGKIWLRSCQKLRSRVGSRKGAEFGAFGDWASPVVTAETAV